MLSSFKAELSYIQGSCLFDFRSLNVSLIEVYGDVLVLGQSWHKDAVLVSESWRVVLLQRSCIFYTVFLIKLKTGLNFSKNYWSKPDEANSRFQVKIADKSINMTEESQPSTDEIIGSLLNKKTTILELIQSLGYALCSLLTV